MTHPRPPVLFAFVAMAFVGVAPVHASPAPEARPEPELLADLRIPAATLDKSGLSGTVGGVPHSRFGGWGSAIERLGGNAYLLLPDRGPLDGGAAYRCRFHRVTISTPTGGTPPVLDTISTTLLSDERDRALMGNSGAFDIADPAGGTRFDPEGVRVAKDGTIYIADEYGPSISAFNAEGKRTATLPVPASFRIDHPSGLADEELPPANTRGRQPNRGFEGLALNASGTRLYALPQSPLLQDHGGVWEEKKSGRSWERTGTNIRVLEVDLATKATRQLVYVLESPKHGVNEILAIDDRRFLVIERDNKLGRESTFKRIMLADLGEPGATDVAAIDALPARGLPGDVRPMTTRPILDLSNPAYKLAADIPEKVEGLAFGPDLPDGRKQLLVTTDNDFRDDQDSRIWIFAIDPKDLGLASPAPKTPEASTPATPEAAAPPASREPR